MQGVGEDLGVISEVFNPDSVASVAAAMAEEFQDFSKIHLYKTDLQIPVVVVVAKDITAIHLLFKEAEMAVRVLLLYDIAEIPQSLPQ
jgi:hypothetical protein